MFGNFVTLTICFGQTAKNISVTLHVAYSLLTELSAQFDDVKKCSSNCYRKLEKKKKVDQKDLPIQNPALSNIRS